MEQDKIIKLIPKIIEAGPEKSQKILADANMPSNQIKIVIQTINEAINRVNLYNMGMKPEQFGGDLDNDPVFKAAIKILQTK